MEVIYPDILRSSPLTLTIDGEKTRCLVPLDSKSCQFEDSFFMDADSKAYKDKPVTHCKLEGHVIDSHGEYRRISDGKLLEQPFVCSTTIVGVNPSTMAPSSDLEAYIGDVKYFIVADTGTKVLGVTGTISRRPKDGLYCWFSGSWSACIEKDTLRTCRCRTSVSGGCFGYNNTVEGAWYDAKSQALAVAEAAIPTDKVLQLESFYALLAGGPWSPSRLPSCRSRFRFNEPAWIFGSGFMLGDAYKFNHLKQSALWAAAKEMKVLNQNSTQSIVEAIQFLLTCKKDGLKAALALPSGLSDLWLQYRYRYTTTRLDIEEAIEFIRWTGVFDLDDTFVCYGCYTDDDGVTCRCKLVLKNRFLSRAGRFWKGLYEYGLQPNFYQVWDFTPFSFVVDWFLPVGDLCDIIDTSNYLDTFDVESICYSLSYREDLETNSLHLTYKVYSRWIEHSLPFLEFCYLYEDDTSDKTILYRCFDAVSLLLGRKRG